MAWINIILRIYKMVNVLGEYCPLSGQIFTNLFLVSVLTKISICI